MWNTWKYCVSLILSVQCFTEGNEKAKGAWTKKKENILKKLLMFCWASIENKTKKKEKPG